MSAAINEYYSPELARYAGARPVPRKQLTPVSQATAILTRIRALTIDSCPAGTVPNPDQNRNNQLTNDQAHNVMDQIIIYFLEASTSPQLDLEEEELIYFQADHPGQIAIAAAPPVPATPVVVAGTHLVCCSINTIIHYITSTTTNRYSRPTTVRQFMRWYTSRAKVLASDRRYNLAGMNHGVPAQYRAIAFDFLYSPFARLTQNEELALSAARFVALEPQEEVTNYDIRYHGGVRPSKTTRRLT